MDITRRLRFGLWVFGLALFWGIVVSYPIAYLITFTTYGTWLHGDRRGSVLKKDNQYGSAFARRSSALVGKEHSVLKNAPFVLGPRQREIALGAIMEVCRFRGWRAHAVHVRSNHVHVVVSGEEKPERMMVDFKAYATRAIRKFANEQASVKKYWTRHGSTRYLWTDESLASAMKYVENGQGRMMTFCRTERRSPER